MVLHHGVSLLEEQRQYSKVNLSMPDVCASSLLDNLWPEDAFGAAFDSQVVPDAIELDLSGVAAGLQEHIHADSPPAQWAPRPDCSAELDDIFGHPSSSAHGLSSADDVDDAVDSFAAVLLGQQQQRLVPAHKAAAAVLYNQQHDLLAAADPAPQPLQQQQEAPDMQWVPTVPTIKQEPAVAAANLTWPCPEELRMPLDTGSLTAAHMVPMVFPATPSPAAAAISSSALPSKQTSTVFSNGLVMDVAAVPSQCPSPFAAAPQQQGFPAGVAADSAGSGTDAAAAAAAVPAGSPKPRAVAHRFGASTYDWAKQLGPAVRSRAEAVARYKAKRARRSTVKRVRYQRRKDYADTRPRVGGRFVKMS